MYELTLLEVFSAAHRLPATGGRCEQLHGHNWKVEVRIRADAVNDVGMVIDFHDLKALTRLVLEELDHTLLNDHAAFTDQLPTAENLARFIYAELSGRLPGNDIRLDRVRVWESETTAASYSE